jgi:membrane protein implicated in regulation of membrane protease activity
MNNFFLICFATGLVLSLVSFAGGFVHLHIGKFHLGHAGGHSHASGGHKSGLSAVNAFTVLAFVTWFGGAGYLLNQAKSLPVFAVYLLASICGFAGAGLLWAALFKVLLPRERVLDAADTEMTGVVARVSDSIRDGGGVGEIIFLQMGSRRASAARSEDDTAIERGAEVVVMRYERGVAYVRRWDELTH